MTKVEEYQIEQMICTINRSPEGFIASDYILPIAEKIASAVAQDIYDTADQDGWNLDDLRLAVGRVLCDRLGIEI